MAGLNLLVLLRVQWFMVVRGNAWHVDLLRSSSDTTSPLVDYLVLCVSLALLSIVLGAWSVTCVSRVDWVDCRCFLSFVFLGVWSFLHVTPPDHWWMKFYSLNCNCKWQDMLA